MMMRLCVALCTVLFALLGMVTGGMAQPEQETSAAAASKDAEAAGSEEAKPDKPKEAADPATQSAASATAASAAGPPQEKAAPGPSEAEEQAAPAPDSVDGSTFIVKLRDLEQRIDELKEQIRRSHTRLSLLSDTILSGGVGGSRAEISFKTDLSDAFRLTRVLVVLDGAVLYNKTDETGGLSDLGRIPVFSGSMPPGDHTVQVKIELRGHGYGVFSYLRGYTFKVEDTHSFTATEGKTVELTIYAYEKGGVTTPLEQRPNLRFVERVTAGARAPAATKGAPGTSGTSVKTGGSASFGVGAP
jgi:hypothetical protein